MFRGFRNSTFSWSMAQQMVRLPSMNCTAACRTTSSEAHVHFQHTAELLSRLIHVGSNVTSRVYPDEDHFFMSRGSQHHLERSLTSYLHNCLRAGGGRKTSQ
ncbi:hypothetical protein XENTR_v10006619 [Xenopus tropicalis]|nr:hypothetical protein XENTR_v10006619 [Xenopus tropicalis]|eukprot:XP_017947172.1 PREDICTED: dipeptidyl aminopeptidase-like protein 6 [Xenopus tropicalis]